MLEQTKPFFIFMEEWGEEWHGTAFEKSGRVLPTDMGWLLQGRHGLQCISIDLGGHVGMQALDDFHLNP